MSIKGVSPAAEPSTIFLGAGAVYVDYGLVTERLLGATAGGSEFDFGRVIEPLEVDAGQGEVQGMHKKTEMIPMLTINLLELTNQSVQDIIPGAVSTDKTSYFEIIENLCMTDDDYETNIAFVGEDKECNLDIIIIVKNAYVSNSPTLTWEKNTAVVPEVEYKGTFGRNALSVVPYEIRYPIADITPPTVISDPVDAASGVAIGATLTFTFNETMDISTLNTSNIILMQQDGTPEPYTLSVDATHKIVTIIQTSDLQAATDYIMMATVGCKDLAGNGLAANEVTNFATA